MGNPPRESLVSMVQNAVQDPRRLRDMEGNVDHLTKENQKTTKQLRKVGAERHELLKQVRKAVITVKKVNDAVGIPCDMDYMDKRHSFLGKDNMHEGQH